MNPDFVRPQQCQRHRKRAEIIDDAIGQQRTQQLIGGHGPKYQQQHRFEYAHAAGHIADDAGGNRNQIEAGKLCETNGRLRRQQHVEHAGGAQQVRAGDGNLRNRNTPARYRDHDPPIAQRLVPGKRQP